LKEIAWRSRNSTGAVGALAVAGAAAWDVPATTPADEAVEAGRVITPGYRIVRCRRRTMKRSADARGPAGSRALREDRRGPVRESTWEFGARILWEATAPLDLAEWLGRGAMTATRSWLVGVAEYRIKLRLPVRQLRP
jgi:hypothetical protein